MYKVSMIFPDGTSQTRELSELMLNARIANFKNTMGQEYKIIEQKSTLIAVAFGDEMVLALEWLPV